LQKLLMRPSSAVAAALISALIVSTAPAAAQDATWLGTPGTSVYNTGSNWSTGTVPTGTASFGASTRSALTFSTNPTLGGWTFNADAVAYTVVNDWLLAFTGAGITVNGGSIVLTNNGETTFRNASSAGSATIGGGGSLFFQSTSTAANATINSTGSVSFSGSSSASNASITTSGSVSFGGSSTAGNASIVAGSVYFSGTGNGGNASIVINGTSTWVGSGTAGNASIVNNGTIYLWEQSSGGNATFTNSASGVLDFGGMTGTVGANPNTMGSLAGAGAVYLGSNRVTVGGNNLSTAFTGIISDCGVPATPCYASFFGNYAGGSLVKTGTGKLTLAGINTYTGATTVNAGTLSVAGSIATSSLTTVNVSGTLSGNGTVGTTTINGGTLAPGNSIGMLSVAGNLAFTSASSYLVEVSPANADRVNVTGTATLGGATVNASFATGSYITKQYTILNAAGGVSGTFGSQVNTNLPTNFTSKLSYDANNAYLNLTLNFVPTPTPDPTPSPPTFGNGLSSNQAGVSSALVNYFNSNGGIPLVFGALTPTGLTQVSGETTAGTQQPGFTAATQFVGTMSDPTVAGRGGNGPGPMAYAEEGDAIDAYASTGRRRSSSERDAFAMITKAAPRVPGFMPRWNVWASGFGGTQTTDGNVASGTNTSSSRIGGVAVGADYWLSPETVAGFALAGGATTFSVAGGGGGRSDLFQVGGFVRHTIGSSYMTASAAYGWQSVTTDRMVGAEQLRAQFDTNSYSARLEAGNRFVTPWLGGVALTPYAAAQVTYLDLPSYAETSAAGTGTFALTYSGKGIAAPRSEVGLRSDKSFAVSDAILMLRGRAAWAHDFNTERSASATFQSLPGTSFVVNGARPASDVALTTAEAELRFVSGISIGATFEGEFSDVTRSYAGKGVVRYAW